MSSKLRAVYDRMYIRVEVLLDAYRAVRGGRKRARDAALPPTLAAAYKNEIRPYWKQFRVRTPKRYWFRAYGSDPRYLPDDLWYARIIPHFNTLLFAQALQDKCLHNLFVPGLRRPPTVVKNVAGLFYDDGLHLLTEEEAVARCRHTGRILAKPSVGSGMGRSIRFYDSDALSEEDVRAIFRTYGRNFIIQEKAAQHPTLAALNPDSLNTIRVLTFLFDGRVNVLSTILRIGGAGSELDNVSRGGFQCTIRPDGTLEPEAITKRSGKWETVEVSSTGIRFAEVKLPNFEKLVEQVRAAAESMGHFRLIGWDIGIDPAGEPFLIEYNVIPEPNQGTCGPTFGELTDAALADVFGRR